MTFLHFSCKVFYILVTCQNSCENQLKKMVAKVCLESYWKLKKSQKRNIVITFLVEKKVEASDLAFHAAARVV